MLFHSYETASCHPVGMVKVAMGYAVCVAETTATSRLPPCVGVGQFAVTLVSDWTAAPACCRRAMTDDAVTVMVAVVLLAVAVPLDVLVTRTPYDLGVVSAGV